MKLKALVDHNVISKIKAALRESLPCLKPCHRVEAMARGLGCKTYNDLRFALEKGRIECFVDDDPFDAYLVSKDIQGFQPYALGEAVGKSIFALEIDPVQVRRVFAPYAISLSLFVNGPSPSPEWLQELNLEINGGRDPSEFFDGPDDPFAEVHRSMPKRDYHGEMFLYRTNQEEVVKGRG